MRQFVLALLAVGLFNVTPAQAAKLNKGADAALRESEQTIGDLANLNLKEQAHAALSKLIETGANELENAGHRREANKLRKDWSRISSTIFGQRDDLGDWEPMSQWLADTYKMMERVLGSGRMRAMHLDDINTVNYAFPITINPHSKINRAEYGEHFVPLMGVASFWSSFGACMHSFGYKRAAHQFCDRVGTYIRGGVMSDIAPSLSDYVYGKINRQTNRDFVVTYDDLVRRYGPGLSRIR